MNVSPRRGTTAKKAEDKTNAVLDEEVNDNEAEEEEDEEQPVRGASRASRSVQRTRRSTAQKEKPSKKKEVRAEEEKDDDAGVDEGEGTESGSATMKKNEKKKKERVETEAEKEKRLRINLRAKESYRRNRPEKLARRRELYVQNMPAKLEKLMELEKADRHAFWEKMEKLRINVNAKKRMLYKRKQESLGKTVKPKKDVYESMEEDIEDERRQKVKSQKKWNMDRRKKNEKRNKEMEEKRREEEEEKNEEDEEKTEEDEENEHEVEGEEEVEKEEEVETGKMRRERDIARMAKLDEMSKQIVEEFGEDVVDEEEEGTGEDEEEKNEEKDEEEDEEEDEDDGVVEVDEVEDADQLADVNEPIVQDVQEEAENATIGVVGSGGRVKGVKVPAPPCLSLHAPIRVSLRTNAAKIRRIAKLRILNPEQYKRRPLFCEEIEALTSPGTTMDDAPKNWRIEPLIQLGGEIDWIAVARRMQRGPFTVVRGVKDACNVDFNKFNIAELVNCNAQMKIDTRLQTRSKSGKEATKWRIVSETGSTKLYLHAKNVILPEIRKELKELNERLKEGNEDEHPTKKRGRMSVKMDEEDEEDEKIAFATNLDVSDATIFPEQMETLGRLHPCLSVNGEDDLLRALEFILPGMNGVQVYPKVRGNRTPGHVENNCMLSFNINIGPGDCTWYFVRYQDWMKMEKELVKREKIVKKKKQEPEGISFLHDTWWPNIEEMKKAGIPVKKLIQRPGDMVCVGIGTVHWVEANGVCANVSWNRGPTTLPQLQMAVEQYEANRQRKFASLVPMELLAWKLAEKNELKGKARNFVRGICLRSLASFQSTLIYVEERGWTVDIEEENNGEDLSCWECKREISTIKFFSRLPRNPKTRVRELKAYCATCSEDLKVERVVANKHIDDLSKIYDKFHASAK